MLKEKYWFFFFNLGDSTFDVSVLKTEDRMFEVESTAGDTHLGEEFDNQTVSRFVAEFKRKHNNTSDNKKTVRYLHTLCEWVKRTFLSNTQVSIEVDSCNEGFNFASIAGAWFEEWNADFFHDTLTSTEKILQDAKLDRSQAHDTVLLAGSTRISEIQMILQDFLNSEELSKSCCPWCSI